MVDVFISYPRVLRPKVEWLKAKLDALGLDCFFDLEGIDGGAEFPVVIDKAVKSAKVVLGCWSPVAFTRPWVIQECRVAKARGVLVPVALEPFDALAIPTEFFGLNYLDISDWNGEGAHEGWTQVVQAVGRYVGRDLTAVVGWNTLSKTGCTEIEDLFLSAVAYAYQRTKKALPGGRTADEIIDSVLSAEQVFESYKRVVLTAQANGARIINCPLPGDHFATGLVVAVLEDPGYEDRVGVDVARFSVRFVGGTPIKTVRLCPEEP